MEEVKVKQGQTLANICIQVYGEYNQLSKLAYDNEKDVTEDLTAGEILLYDPAFGNNENLKLLKDRTIINL